MYKKAGAIGLIDSCFKCARFYNSSKNDNSAVLRRWWRSSDHQQHQIYEAAIHFNGREHPDGETCWYYKQKNEKSCFSRTFFRRFCWAMSFYLQSCSIYRQFFGWRGSSNPSYNWKIFGWARMTVKNQLILDFSGPRGFLCIKGWCKCFENIA